MLTYLNVAQTIKTTLVQSLDHQEACTHLVTSLGCVQLLLIEVKNN